MKQILLFLLILTLLMGTISAETDNSTFPFPPRNLTANVGGTEGRNVTLNWQAPVPVSSLVISHSPTVSSLGGLINLGPGNTSRIAQRFTPEQLLSRGIPETGINLDRVRFSVGPNPRHQYSLIIQKGGSQIGSLFYGGREVYNQNLGHLDVSGTAVTWRDVFLTEPVIVDLSEEIWIVIEVRQAEPDPKDGPNWNIVHSRDQGPAVNGYGNLIMRDGVWHSAQLPMFFGQLANWNWNIRGFVMPENPDLPEQPFSHYRIYRDGFPIATTTDLTFVETNAPIGDLIYQVRAIYDGNLASVPVSARARSGNGLLIITQFPFEQNFNDNLFPPHSWSNIDADGDGRRWFRRPRGRGGEGTFSAASASLDTATRRPDNWLITPRLQLPPKYTNHNFYLRYWVATSWRLRPEEHYSIMVSTTDTELSSFKPIFNERLTPQHINWHENIVSLAGYEDGHIYIAFRHHDSVGQEYLLLDEIWVGQLHDDLFIFNPPSNLSAIAGDGRVSLTWTAPTVAPLAISRLLGYKIFRDGEVIANFVPETSYVNIRGIFNGETYEYFVKAVYEHGGISVASNTVTATPVGDATFLHPPSNLSHIIDEDDVVLSWEIPIWTDPKETRFSHNLTGEVWHVGDPGIPIDTGFTVASRFTPRHIQDFGLTGLSLTGARLRTGLVGGGVTNATGMKVAVWIGEEPGPLLFQAHHLFDMGIVQPATWVDFMFPYPVPIPDNQNIYLGVWIGNRSFISNRVDISLGPNENLYVNHGLLFMPERRAENRFGNLLIQGIAGLSDNPSTTSVVFGNVEEVHSFNAQLSLSYMDSYQGDSQLSNRSILGYNVFRNNVKLTQSPITELTYRDINAPAGYHNYGVSVIWNTGESVPSNVFVIKEGDLTVTDFPYIVDFEFNHFPPIGWSRFGPGTGNWTRVSPGRSSSIGMAQSIGTTENWLVSPTISVPTLTGQQRFYLRYFRGSVSPMQIVPSYSVLVSDDDGITFTEAVPNSELSTHLWVSKYIDLTTYANKDIIVAFIHHANVNASTLNIDDITFEIHQGAIYSDPPINFALEEINEDVRLSWNAPPTRTPDHYIIFKNDIALPYQIRTLEFIDIAPTKLVDHRYFVRAFYINPEGASEPSPTLTINIDDPYTRLFPPRILTAEFEGDSVHLEWIRAASPNHFTHVRDNVFTQALAWNGPAAVYHRFTPSQLTNMGVAGTELVQVGFATHSTANNVVFEIRIYTGGSSLTNPGTLVHTQRVTQTIIGNDIIPSVPIWNDIDLNTRISIPTNQELWIGYYVENRLGGFPFGNCTTPVIDEFNNILHWNNELWTTTVETTNPPQSWLIRGSAIGEDGQPIMVSHLPSSHESFTLNNSSRVLQSNENLKAEFAVDPDMLLNDNSFTFEGYRIFRNGIEITTGLLSDTTFRDTTGPWGKIYTYEVIADYNTMISTPSKTIIYAGEHTPPSSLNAIGGDGVINLSWTAPLNEYQYFRLYRDNRLIADQLNITTFADVNITRGISYSYHVTAMYYPPRVESNPSNTVSAAAFGETEELYPPTDLLVETDGNDVNLSWGPAGLVVEMEFTHANLNGPFTPLGNVIEHGVGWAVAQRYSAAQLVEWGAVGLEMTHITFLSGYGPGLGYVVNLWINTVKARTDDNWFGADRTVDIGRVPENTWITVELPRPVLITGYDDIFVGYFGGNLVPGTLPSRHDPLVVDAGPRLPNYGYLGVDIQQRIFFNEAWNGNLAIMALARTPGRFSENYLLSLLCEENSLIQNNDIQNHNFNHLSMSTEPLLKGDSYIIPSLELNALGSTRSSRSFVGFNVYRGELLLTSSPITELEFIENNVPVGVWEYNVTAVYNTDQESEPASGFAIIRGDVFWTEFPQQEDFNRPVFPPVGWEISNNNNRAWEREILNNNDLNGRAVSRSWITETGAITPNNWLITPQITVPNDMNTTEGFYLTYLIGSGHRFEFAEQFSVLVSKTDKEPDSFTEIVHNETLQNWLWSRRWHDLSEFAGEKIYIAFRHHDTSGQFSLILDDIWLGVASDYTTNPARNLVATTDTDKIVLSWDAPTGNRNPIAYRVYKNNNLLSIVQNRTLIDEDVVRGITNTYHVIAIYDNPPGEAEPSNIVRVAPHASQSFVVRNLDALYDGHVVDLTWDVPGKIFTHHTSWTETVGIGTGGSATFGVAQRWSTRMLLEQGLAGQNLESVDLWLTNKYANYILRIWTGGRWDSYRNSGTVIYERALLAGEFMTNQWVNVPISTNITIPHEEEIWIGYIVNSPSGFPASADNGPSIDGYGNLMLWGNTWQTLRESGANLNFNWLIRATASIQKDVEGNRQFEENIPVLNPMEVILTNNGGNPTIDLGNPLLFSNNSMESSVININIQNDVYSSRFSSKALKGFNVYRDNSPSPLNPSPIMSLQFGDNTAQLGQTYNYHVVSVFDSGESQRRSINILAMAFLPPSNFTATPGDRSVALSWNTPTLPSEQSASIVSYKIYRDGILLVNLDSQPLVNSFIDDKVLNTIEYEYWMVAVYTNPNRESRPTNSIKVTPDGSTHPLFPPRDLSLVLDENNVLMQWAFPSTEAGGWFSHVKDFNISNYVGISVTGPVQFSLAHRYRPETLQDIGASGMKLSRVQHFIWATACQRINVIDVSFHLGTRNEPFGPGERIHTHRHRIIGFDAGWQDIEITNPITIPFDTELWVVLTIHRLPYPAPNHNMSVVPLCTGPVEYGFGDLVYWNGEWRTIRDIGLSAGVGRNIALRLYAQESNETLLFGANGTISTEEYPIYSDFDICRQMQIGVGLESEINNRISFINNENSLIGFNVFIDGILQNQTPFMSSIYVAQNLNAGERLFELRAVYPSGMSTPLSKRLTIPTVVTIPITNNQGWSERFVGANWPYAGWTTHRQGGGSGLAWTRSTNVAHTHSQPGGALISDSGTTANPIAPDNWLITPRFDLTEINVSEDPLLLSFWIAGFNQTNFANYYQVRVSKTGNAIFNFLTDENKPYISGIVESNAYGNVVIDLSAYAGENIYIAFRHFNTPTGQGILRLDTLDLSVGSVSAEDITSPTLEFALEKNFPNPFNPETTIRFSIGDVGNVMINVYNVRGQRVRTLVNEQKEPGHHSVVWNGTDDFGRAVSSGIYLYRMVAGENVATQRMLLMK